MGWTGFPFNHVFFFKLNILICDKQKVMEIRCPCLLIFYIYIFFLSPVLGLHNSLHLLFKDKNYTFADLPAFPGSFYLLPKFPNCVHSCATSTSQLSYCFHTHRPLEGSRMFSSGCFSSCYDRLFLSISISNTFRNYGKYFRMIKGSHFFFFPLHSTSKP